MEPGIQSRLLRISKDDDTLQLKAVGHCRAKRYSQPPCVLVPPLDCGQVGDIFAFSTVQHLLSA
jgi:hypothetical protein